MPPQRTTCRPGGVRGLTRGLLRPRELSLRNVEKPFSLIAANAWNVVEEFVDSLSMLEVLNQRVDGYPRVREDRRAAEDVGIPLENLFAFHGLTLYG
jgi:hypothetical protein